MGCPHWWKSTTSPGSTSTSTSRPHSCGAQLCQQSEVIRGHLKLEEHIASQCEVIRAVVSDYSQPANRTPVGPSYINSAPRMLMLTH